MRTAKEGADAHQCVNTQREVKIESDKHRDVAQTRATEEVLKRQAVKDKAEAITEAEQDGVLFVKRQEARAAETQAEF